MPDPISIGVLAASALATAADATLKGLVGEGIKDAYKALRDKVAHWAGPDVEALEKTPASTARQAVIAEEIDRQAADEQEVVRALANALVEALKKDGVAEPRSMTVTATHGGVAAGRDMSGNTITTHGAGQQKS